MNRTIALLHQYQREAKTVEHRGEQIRYVEAKREDIAIANRLAGEVLGRSLDELPPQTRRLLGLLDELVTTESQRMSIDRGDFRFSRRTVREHTRWGQTQLRIHLGRLVEMEYLAVHRGGHCQGYLYELIWEGECGCLVALSEPGNEGTTPTWRGSEADLAGGWRACPRQREPAKETLERRPCDRLGGGLGKRIAGAQLPSERRSLEARGGGGMRCRARGSSACGATTGPIPKASARGSNATSSGCECSATRSAQWATAATRWSSSSSGSTPAT